jgi:hypothetical protein
MKASRFKFFLLVFISVSTYAQGKLFSKSEASKLFGPVQYSSTISKADLQKLLTLDNSARILFTSKAIFNLNKVILYGNDVISKTPRYPVIYHAFGKDMLKRLIEVSTTDYITIETREEVLSLSSGDNVLEFSMPCPPYCEVN